jgi:hypothetical protein
MIEALLDALLADYIAAPTLAKAANPANREHGRGLAADSTPCEGLRISANGRAGADPGEQNSQAFASVRKPPSSPQRQQQRGFSQNSQDSQGVACNRHFRLTPEQAERCHAGGWTDAEIALFVERHARLMRRGFTDGDADDLAERLTLRDREGDGRRLCIECLHLKAWRCGNHAAADVAPELGRSLATLLQRCAGFEPMEAE